MKSWAALAFLLFSGCFCPTDQRIGNTGAEWYACNFGFEVRVLQVHQIEDGTNYCRIRVLLSFHQVQDKTYTGIGCYPKNRQGYTSRIPVIFSDDLSTALRFHDPYDCELLSRWKSDNAQFEAVAVKLFRGRVVPTPSVNSIPPAEPFISLNDAPDANEIDRPKVTDTLFFRGTFTFYGHEISKTNNYASSEIIEMFIDPRKSTKMEPSTGRTCPLNGEKTRTSDDSPNFDYILLGVKWTPIERQRNLRRMTKSHFFWKRKTADSKWCCSENVHQTNVFCEECDARETTEEGEVVPLWTYKVK